jgi:hypothetical protein
MSQMFSPSLPKHVVSTNNAVWLGLLIFVSGALTATYSCITPFAAFAAIAAATLSRRGGVVVIVALWLVNQAVGFGMLHYPWTASTVAWGIAIGGAAVMSTVAAQSTIRRLSSRGMAVAVLIAFTVAFASYELILYGTAASFLGGRDAFSAAIIVEVLLVNTAALMGLVGLNQVATVIIRGVRRREARADFA